MRPGYVCRVSYNDEGGMTFEFSPCEFPVNAVHEDIDCLLDAKTVAICACEMRQDGCWMVYHFYGVMFPADGYARAYFGLSYEVIEQEVKKFHDYTIRLAGDFANASNN